MKLLGYILSFYILLLSAVPCCAFDNCADDKTVTEQPGHENGDGDCGNCSPFFNCQGCATATVDFQPVQFEITAIKISTSYAAYIQLSLSDVDYDFWQPPRLS